LVTLEAIFCVRLGEILLSEIEEFRAEPGRVTIWFIGGCASGLLAINPVLIFGFAVQKYPVTGLIFGAIKGR